MKASARPNLKELLISSGDVADMIGVGRAAISNYKKRHSSFPAPAFTDSNGRVQLYWIADIEGWIVEHFGDLNDTASALERRAVEMQERANRLRGLAAMESK